MSATIEVTNFVPSEEKIRETVVELLPDMIEFYSMSFKKFMEVAKNKFGLEPKMISNRHETKKYLVLSVA